MLPWYILLLLLLSAFVIAYFSMPRVIKLAFRLGAVDSPDQRKVHSRTMPRMGGTAIFLAFMITMIVCMHISGKYGSSFAGMLYGAALIFAVGLLDDIFQLSPLVKLSGQIIAAAIAIYGGLVVHFVANPFDGFLQLGYFAIPVTFLWIVGITNAINLIDGLDGLAAGVSVLAAVTMGIIAIIKGQPLLAVAAFILAASILGFLPYNFNPARSFMGDSGSNFLGFVLACLAIMGTAKSAALISLLMPVVILGIPIFDTCFAIVRRVYNKNPIFLPDKDHLHHRLLALGMSHRTSVLVIYAISALFNLVAVVLTLINNPKANLALILLLLLVIAGADRIGLMTGEKSSNRTQLDTDLTLMNTDKLHM
ncbi:glycosyltransferase family 4 protein [Syntrophomonas palmitatica]|uniref:glycosyltransferase family 4 protein n=1 Tax=Syntrophomonas palmitatica TaxID=402877 RepID=UPI0006D24EDF|nr:MraY family glycosyltransferase [Syntrophomonas palmitatica]